MGYKRKLINFKSFIRLLSMYHIFNLIALIVRKFSLMSDLHFLPNFSVLQF
jgi:hypothetical protein